MGSSTPLKVEPTTGGSTSTFISTAAESTSTEETRLTSSAEPQPSTTSPTTSDMLTSEKSSTSHPTTTDFTSSIMPEYSSSKDPNNQKPSLRRARLRNRQKLPQRLLLRKQRILQRSLPRQRSQLLLNKSQQPHHRQSRLRKPQKPFLKRQVRRTQAHLQPLCRNRQSSTTSTFTKSKTPNLQQFPSRPPHPKTPPPTPSAPNNVLMSALAYCKTIDRQTLASLDKIKDNSDIKLIQESAALQNIDWIYANGIGAKDERFLKKASVYSIYNQSLVSSPIVKTIGISQLFTNISALCVMPQYCNMMDCDVEKIFQAYEFYNNFKQTAGTLEPRRSGTVTCIYGNQKSTTVTCNTLGAIYPNPTNIDCEESATERQLKDTTNDLVSDCKACYKRGTKECQKVMDETNQDVKGYQCICKEPYSMSTCWRTVNNCNSTICGDHGTCMSEMGHMWCDCKWGYTGDHCDEALDEKYDGDIGFSSAVGATITIGDGIFRFLKICVMGLLKGDGGFDPQSTHQTFRWVCILCANALITLYSNPTLLAIPLIQCRFTFIAIHFFYVQGNYIITYSNSILKFSAMVQWLLEGFNVNQVLRCVHLNEWERDIHGNKSLGVRIWPRFIVSVFGVAFFVRIPFTAGWNKLAASWTCVGVICQETLHVWFPIFFCRRPLLGFRLDYEIERRVGWEAGKIFQKCRDDELMCFIGVIFLVAQWVSVIISSHHRDEKFYGMITVVVSGIYFAFSTYQEIMTNPEVSTLKKKCFSKVANVQDRANFYTLLQRFLPFRAAPAYNPETTWTIDEVKEYFNTPKKEREEQYEGFINRNQQLFIHHKLDIRMNEFLAEDPKMTIDEALIKVFTAEMNDLKKNNGSGREKLYIQATFVAYCDTIPHFEPRPTEKLQCPIWNSSPEGECSKTLRRTSSN
ncbi:Protein CBG10696 [Caenorhabditis briggsae]|uniref:Protein CBG10696 n=1 Tax=Caenorhabditis briggsae TaxID=6238 RepID=A8XBK9_CAEBR|nr:Protein CBG10696 [Caenorhabditis briggsae]CAP30025.2 Protein CBG10696 [Caenorhabditis briggsae]